jgi:hypothetical protein
MILPLVNHVRPIIGIYFMMIFATRMKAMENDPSVSDSLSDPDRMLSAVENLQTNRRNRSALRTMSIDGGEARPVEAIMAKAEQSLQRPQPISPLLTPRL